MDSIRVQMTASIKSAISHHQAIKDKAISDLDIYLNRPVGSGNESSPTDIILSLLEKLEKANSSIEFINSIIIKEEENLIK